MPLGIPRAGGSPIGGPIIPRGGAIIPGGGVARPRWGPLSWWVLSWGPRNAGSSSNCSSCYSSSSLWSHYLLGWPPTPQTGPANPTGAWGIGTPAGTSLPAALPTPGRPAAPANGTRAMPVSLGGGPSTVMEAKFSPRSNTRPKTRFSSRSGCFTFLGLIFLNSSQSQRIKFIRLSKALKVPMKIWPSCKIHLIL
uniref:Uncharacterized protein n=2 Tax=Canis lupus TaxID=9612 RepID=A0A8P0T0B5_CANLF